MWFKRTIPYFLTSAAMVFGASQITSGTNDEKTDKSTTNYMPSETMVVANIPYAIPSMDASHNSSDNIVDATAQQYDVVYTRANGNKVRRSGGTRAWRNNNPGCLRYSEFTITQGAIGHAGGFAVFPDEETGMQAICALLQSDSYKNLTISQAIFKYAPPHENDTENYKASLRKMTELPITTKLCDLTSAQILRVAHAIRKIEGWKPGQETQIIVQSQPKPESCDTLYFYSTIKDNILHKSFARTM